MPRTPKKSNDSAATVGYEAQLWQMADALSVTSEGEKTHRSVDLLGRVYEYFLTRFASAEGKNGGQFYTPSCVVRCLVEMLAPYKGASAIPPAADAR